MARKTDHSDDPGVIPMGVDGPPSPDSVADDPVALDVWGRLAPSIDPSEAGTLAAYCRAYSRAERLQAAIAELDDVMVTSDTGVSKVHPLFGALNGTDRVLGQLADKLGITPVTRDKVKKKPVTAAAKVKKISRYL